MYQVGRTADVGFVVSRTIENVFTVYLHRPIVGIYHDSSVFYVLDIPVSPDRSVFGPVLQIGRSGHTQPIAVSQ